MASAVRRSLPNRPHNSARSKPRDPEDASKGIWSALLDSVATGKRLTEKNVVVLGVPSSAVLRHSLGGTPDSQRDFLEGLSHSDNPQQRSRNLGRSRTKPPPIANRFALGYTYHDIVDADHDDVLARLSLHFLSTPHPSFMPLLTPLFPPSSIPDSLVVVLLSWNEPCEWLAQLRAWIRVIRAALARTDNATKDAMDDNMKAWTERRKGNVSVAASDSQTPALGTDTGSGGAARPPGPGEWDEPLGVPLCVVCQYAEETETLSSDNGWRDESHFDVVLQYLRTVLLKHGASLLYTSSAAPGQLQTLIRASLDVRSLLRREDLRYNIIEREKICIPPGWDSWGKIKGMNENFDCDGISKAWSIDIEGEPEQPEDAEAEHKSQSNHEKGSIQNTDSAPSSDPTSPSPAPPSASTLPSYSRAIPNPNADTSAALTLGAQKDPGIQVHCPSNQEFLASQLQILETLKAEDEADASSLRQGKSSTGQAARRPGGSATTGSSTTAAPATPNKDGEGKQMENMIGPVQFNVGGIQVDADEMLKSLQSRQGQGEVSTPGPKDASDGTSTPGGSTDTPDRLENQNLKNFFEALKSRGGGSAASSPK
ncbi:MAG: hypothetical protein M1828_000300 [Chrysothrix sp. TS-e1954]|nr:MAG: hypothetical protein M1828_000300 [Chrysothrix sp. TS-e1954]